MNLARLRRPLIAGVLSLLVAGAGHLYLRRYRRAAGWLLLTVATSVLLVSPEAARGLLDGGTVDVVELAPVYLVTLAGALDAARTADRGQRTLSVSADGELLTCPACGNDLDPSLDFCHWCTTDLDQFTVVHPDERHPERDAPEE